MQQMIKSIGVKQALMAEAPPGIIALLIAEIFYKFGSFTWECLAFLATWFALSLIYNALKRIFVKTPLIGER